VGEISKGRFAARVRTLTTGHQMLEKIAGAMLRARAALQTEFARLHRAMLAIARENEVCRRLMTVPGVGALIAVTFTAAVDQPERFARSRAVGAQFGLTPKKYHTRSANS
jgi:transposase